jgi:hypothetical protein
MVRGSVRRAFCASFNLCRPVSGVAVAVLAASLGACSSQSTARFASMAAAPPPGATIAFESIDGPPPQVFNKLVASLNDEAGAQRIAVVSRNAPATYRVRGYVTAAVDRNKTTFGWVWDVYDADKRRALRISGEEPGGIAGRRDAWASADEAVLRRMARSGMQKIAGFLDSPAPLPAAAPEMPLPTLVAGRDDSPEGAGIFRLMGGQDSKDSQNQTTGSVAPEPVDDPPPARPAKAKKRKTAAVVAPSTDGRATTR